MMTTLLAAAAVVGLAVGVAHTGDPISAVIHLAHGSRRWRRFI
jgi:hypothetical protein